MRTFGTIALASGSFRQRLFCGLTILLMAGAARAAKMPVEEGTDAVPVPHFPDREHAFVWRNWPMVEVSRLAEVLGTSPENVRAIAEAMGLPAEQHISPFQAERGYISVIRRNWHLLPVEQLLTLLGWDADRLAYTLKEDDFLWVKLGFKKPRCAPLAYRPPDEAVLRRCAEIKAIMQTQFGELFQQPMQPRFQFVEDLSRPVAAFEKSESTDEPIRFLYSYFAVYGDPLLDPSLDPYPDGLLQRLANHGVNGVWLHTVLRQLAPSKEFPEFGVDHETRLANLNRLVQRAKAHGIKIYLYMNEPRSMPKEFFQNHPDIAGVSEEAFTAMCSSTPQVQSWLKDALSYVFRRVPDLGGVFTITASENLTHCCCHYNQDQCPRCSKREPAEVIAEVNRLIADGVHEGNPQAKVIVWDWGWKDEWAADLITRLPSDVYLMSVSEWSLPVNRGGVSTTVGEYSISAVGPGPRATHHWELAKQRGLKPMAKVQANCTWEISAMPWLPTMDLVAQHLDGLRRVGISDMMLSWTLGGYPSPNLQLVREFQGPDFISPEEALRRVAQARYGPEASPYILAAWSAFSRAFAEFPYHNAVVYCSPVQVGPANLLYLEPTGYQATMVGFPYDDIDRWRGPYPAEVFAGQLEKVAQGWRTGLAEFGKAIEQASASHRQTATADQGLAEAAGLHFRSVVNQARFVIARDALRSAEITAEKRSELTTQMRAILKDEIKLASRLCVLACQDARIGYEASNHYYYYPLDLVEKAINAQYLLAQLEHLSGKQSSHRTTEAPGEIVFENKGFKHVLGTDGRNRHFIDKHSGKDYCLPLQDTSFARIQIEDRQVEATSVVHEDSYLKVCFGDTGTSAVLRVETHDRYLVYEVVSLEGDDVDTLTFIDVPLATGAATNDSFATCALALNLKTNVLEIPQPATRLRAYAYRRFGFSGARVALVGCSPAELRAIMKEIVNAADDLPKSPIGGPWALDARCNHESYLIDMKGEITEEVVDQWIEMARNLGFRQIDFHTGHSMRFGDYEPNPKLYPHGAASVRAAVEKIHAAGMLAGFHTYAFFIGKDTPWVTPKPDPRLAKTALFTLSRDLTMEAGTIEVAESTANMSAATGFHVRNSATIQIDDELIVFGGVSPTPPFAFTECRRGSYGTKAATHAVGAKVHHLKECFGLFLPDGDSTLFTEVARKTADVYNSCGFDMIYLDALDGSDLVAGWQNAWHYGSKFVFELCKQLEKPALFEMSTFHHHLWYVRSRMGAWDVPARGAKPFIDMHTLVNEVSARQYLPTNLGWWGAFNWAGIQPERTFPDILEYLCGKCIGYDSSLSLLVGFSPEEYASSDNTRRLAAMIKRYEQLRQSGYFSESVKKRLRVHGDEFTLEQIEQDRWQFVPVDYLAHKVDTADSRSLDWTMHNRFRTQPVRLRIEALMSAGDDDPPDNPVLADFSNPEQFSTKQARKGVAGTLSTVSEPVRVGPVSGCLEASNNNSQISGSWIMWGKSFSPYLDLRNRGLGVWIYGDGQGEILNFQLRNPPECGGTIRDGYVPIDFTGWRYFRLIEPESQRVPHYDWPYFAERSGWPEQPHRLMSYAYPVFHIWMDYSRISSLNIWFNNLPPGKAVRCYLGPIRAIPLVSTRIKNPSVTLNDRTIIFPVELESGGYIEYQGTSACTAYDANGEPIRKVRVRGEAPRLQSGSNSCSFSCEQESMGSGRVRVTLIGRGDPI